MIQILKGNGNLSNGSMETIGSRTPTFTKSYDNEGMIVLNEQRCTKIRS